MTYIHKIKEKRKCSSGRSRCGNENYSSPKDPGFRVSTCFHNLSVTETCTRCLISLKHFTTLSYPCPLLHMRWGRTHTQLCMMGSNFRGHIRPQHAQTGQPETTQRITQKYKSTHRDRARQVLRGNSGVRHAHLKEYMQIEPRITM